MANNIPTVRPQDLFNLLSEEAHCQIVDVRERFEFEEARLDGSLFVPLSRLHKDWSLIDHEKPGYLLCRSGKRAEIAALELAKNGFTNLMVVSGGLEAWIAAGYPLRSPSRGSGFGQAGLFAVLGASALGLIVVLNDGNPAWLLLALIAPVCLMYLGASVRPRKLATAALSPTTPAAHSRD